MSAKVAMGLLLVVVFIMVGLRNIDPVVTSFVASIVAGIGFFLAFRARKWTRRHSRVGEEDSISVIAYWGNAILLLGSILIFCYKFAIGVLRGDFL